MPTIATTRASGFPVVKRRDDGGLEIQDRVYSTEPATYSTFTAALPAIGAEMADTEEDAVLIAVERIEPKEYNSTWYADLLYATNGDVQWFFEQARSEQSIEYKKALHGGLAFLQKWKYDLAAQYDLIYPAPAALPSFYATATSAATVDDASKWKWVEVMAELGKDSAGKEWGIHTAKTKPGLSSFITGAVSVRNQFKVCTEAEASAYMSDFAGVVGKRNAPSKTYGYTSSADNWLVTDMTLTPSGYYFVITTRWQYAPEGWDKDVYIEFTASP